MYKNYFVRNPRNFWIGAVIICLSACSEVIDLGTKPTDPVLIVYGRITDGTAGNEISIFESSERSDGAQNALTGAEIDLIEDGVLIGQYVEEDNRPGHYRLEMPNDSARQGRMYEVSITLPNGDRVLSKPSTMPGLMARDSIYVDVDLVDLVINERGFKEPRKLSQLFVDTEILDSEADFFLKWNVVEAYTAVETPRCCGTPPPPCYITNDITRQDPVLFNGADLKPAIISGQNMANTVIDGRFAFAYYYMVIQSTIDEAAHNYWSQVGEVASLTGTIFDKTVGNVGGNLFYPDKPNEQVFGYFEVARVDTNWTWLNSDNFSFFLREPCPAARTDEAPPECSSCLIIKNSSHHRPYFYQ